MSFVTPARALFFGGCARVLSPGRHGESVVNDGSERRYKCLFGGDDV